MQEPQVEQNAGRRGAKWWIVGAAAAAAVLAAAAAALYASLIPPAPPAQPTSVSVALSEEQTVPLPPGDWTRPAWHPTGSALVCTEVGKGESHLWLAPLDGSSPVPLTTRPGRQSTATGRVWARQGLLFSSNERGEDEVFLLDTYTFATRPLPFKGGSNKDASWAPDELHIVLSRREYGRGRTRLWIATTSGLVRPLPLALAAPGDPFRPAWAPHEPKLLFQYGEPGGWDLYTLELPADVTLTAAPEPTSSIPPTATGGSTATPPPATTPEPTPAVTPLIVGPGDQTAGVWAGLSGDMLFVDQPTTETAGELYAVVGGVAMRLTRNNVPEGSPSASPDGSRIAFERGEAGERVIVVARLVRLSSPG